MMSFFLPDIPERQRRPLLLLIFFVLVTIALTAIIGHSPRGQYLDRLSFRPRAEPYVLGYDLLGQYPGAFSADKSHVLLQFDRNRQTWQMSNISANGKKLLFITPKQEEFLSRQWHLQDNDTIVLGGHQLTVRTDKAGRLRLEDSAGKYSAEWDFYRLKPQGRENFAGCPHATWLHALRRYIQHRTYRLISGSDNSFTLGGQVSCVDRLALPGVELFAAKIGRNAQGKYYLRPAPGEAISLIRNGRPLALPPVTLDPANRFIIGRSTYRLELSKQHVLTIIPVSNIHFFPQQEQAGQPHHPAAPDKDITVQWRDKRDFARQAANPRSLAVLLLLAVVVGFYGRWLKSSCRRFRARLYPGLIRVQVLATVLCFGIWCLSAAAEPLLMLLLLLGLWVLTSVQVCCYGRTRAVHRFWLLLSFLCFLGLAMQLQLAVGGLSSRWYHYPDNHMRFFAVLFLAVLLLMPLPYQEIYRFGALFQQHDRANGFGKQALLLVLIWCWAGAIMLLLFAARQTPATAVRIGLLVPAGLLLIFGLRWLQAHRGIGVINAVLSCFALAMLAQLCFGSEEGVAGVQPIELGKTLLIWLLSAALLRYQECLNKDPASYRQRLRRLRYVIGPVVLVLLTAILLVSVGVHDDSPLVITAFLVFSYLWLFLWPFEYKVSYMTLFCRLLFVLFCLALTGGIYALYGHPQWITEQPYFPRADRFLIWMHPWDYPDSGRQLQLALSAVHGNGNNWTGMHTLGANGSIQALPAVQDDFAPAFYLHKFGGLGGLLLLLVQIKWLRLLADYCLLGIAEAKKNDHTQQNILLFLAYSLYGFAVMQGIHWLISWGNSLGFLPIMGQPMTFLSAGNSHLFALALPMSLSLLALIKLCEKEQQ